MSAEDQGLISAEIMRLLREGSKDSIRKAQLLMQSARESHHQAALPKASADNVNQGATVERRKL